MFYSSLFGLSIFIVCTFGMNSQTYPKVSQPRYEFQTALAFSQLKAQNKHTPQLENGKDWMLFNIVVHANNELLAVDIVTNHYTKNDIDRCMNVAGRYEATTENQISIIGHAVSSGMLQLVKAMVNKGASPNIRSEQKGADGKMYGTGYIPLSYAIANRDQVMISALLISDLILVGSSDGTSGTNVLQYAKTQGMTDVMQKMMCDYLGWFLNDMTDSKRIKKVTPKVKQLVDFIPYPDQCPPVVGAKKKISSSKGNVQDFIRKNKWPFVGLFSVVSVSLLGLVAFFLCKK